MHRSFLNIALDNVSIVMNSVANALLVVLAVSVSACYPRYVPTASPANQSRETVVPTQQESVPAETVERTPPPERRAVSREFCEIAQLWLPFTYESAGLNGRTICELGGGTFCSSVDTIGEGICRAGNGMSCAFVEGIGEGLCRGSGAPFCSSFDGDAQGVCHAGGEGSCSRIETVGQGICEAMRRPFCRNVDSIGEGVCEAGNGMGCSHVSSLGEGICRAEGRLFCTGGMSVAEAVCEITGTCTGGSTAAAVYAVIGVCGAAVLHAGY